jgi:hypothetical protein
MRIEYQAVLFCIIYCIADIFNRDYMAIIGKSLIEIEQLFSESITLAASVNIDVCRIMWLRFHFVPFIEENIKCISNIIELGLVFSYVRLFSSVFHWLERMWNKTCILLRGNVLTWNIIVDCFLDHATSIMPRIWIEHLSQMKLLTKSIKLVHQMIENLHLLFYMI